MTRINLRADLYWNGRELYCGSHRLTTVKSDGRQPLFLDDPVFYPFLQKTQSERLRRGRIVILPGEDWKEVTEQIYWVALSTLKAKRSKTGDLVYEFFWRGETDLYCGVLPMARMLIAHDNSAEILWPAFAETLREKAGKRWVDKVNGFRFAQTEMAKPFLEDLYGAVLKELNMKETAYALL